MRLETIVDRSDGCRDGLFHESGRQPLLPAPWTILFYHVFVGFVSCDIFSIFNVGLLLRYLFCMVAHAGIGPSIVFQTGCSPSAVSGYTNFRATTNITYKIMTSYLAVMQCGTI